MLAHDRAALIDQLVLHEGLILRPYMDSVGKITIGVGRNLSDKGLSSAEAMTLLDHDIDEAVLDCTTSFPWFADLDPIRQRVLVDMRFNLGPARFRTFKRMLRAAEEGAYLSASTAMMESMWFRQVKTRGERLCTMMRTGKDYSL